MNAGHAACPRSAGRRRSIALRRNSGRALELTALRPLRAGHESRGDTLRTQHQLRSSAKFQRGFRPVAHLAPCRRSNALSAETAPRHLSAVMSRAATVPIPTTTRDAYSCNVAALATPSNVHPKGLGLPFM